MDKNLNGPMISRSNTIPHYYGDYVRVIFLAAAAIVFVGLPLFSDLLPFDAVVEVVAALFIVVFAALTNPFKKWVMFVNVVIAGCGVLITEVTAIKYFEENELLIFAIREALAILFLFGLYFSMKTLRAMHLKQIGKGGSIL